MMQILRAKKFKMKTSMSKKKRLGSELERKEAMEKYLEVKFAEEELQKELDEAKSDSDSEVMTLFCLYKPRGLENLFRMMSRPVHIPFKLQL